MLIITGTQRSGTSLLAKALKMSGYDLGSTLWDEEVQGGLESDLICGFYRNYLGDPTFPFDDFDVPVVSSFTFGQLGAGLPGQAWKVAKFSYLLMNPIFVMIWNKFRPVEKHNDTFLVLQRPPEDVISSKNRYRERFAHDSVLLTQNAWQLEDNYDNSLDLIQAMGYNYVVIHFPKFLKWNCSKLNEHLRRLDPKVQITPTIWKEVVDPSLVHF